MIGVYIVLPSYHDYTDYKLYAACDVTFSHILFYNLMHLNFDMLLYFVTQSIMG